MKGKLWIAGWLALVLLMGGAMGYMVYRVDPFMHYHKPDTTRYYYALNNQRSQNNGITKHFDYDALITGSSLTENFKTSEMDEIFGCTSIKVSYSGGSYKELSDNIRIGLEHNPNLKTVVRCLDMVMFLKDKDTMRTDLGVYPTYLYDDNPLNDVKYLLNRDIIWKKAYDMILATQNSDFVPGITSFDDYACWQYSYTFGLHTVAPEGFAPFEAGEPNHLTREERETLKGTIEQNITALANAYPQVDFYYYISPYSIAWWRAMVENGDVYKRVEAEQYVIELILPTENIRLFSFNNRYDITTNLNNYKDNGHYGTWINSLVLKWMHDGQGRLTKENYQAYLEDELHYYTTFDYMSLNSQVDYEDDYYIAELLRDEMAPGAQQ